MKYLLLNFILFFSIVAQDIHSVDYSYNDVLPVIETKEQFNSLFLSLDDYTKENQERTNSDSISRIYLVRHGQSIANQQRINAGQTINAPLSENGYVQAEKAARILLRQVNQFSGVYSTPLQRTAQTIDVINQTWLKERSETLPEAMIIEELIEKHCGSLEGATEEVYKPFKQKEEKDISNCKTFKEKFSYKMLDEEASESLEDVFRRAVPALTQIGQRHIGENVLICTHVGVMRSIIIGLLASKANPVDLEVTSFDLPNTAIIIVEFDNETQILTVKAANDLTFKR